MTTEQDLDAALALFNEGLDRQKADQRAARALQNAEKAKQQAAATLKRLQDDGAASAEDRAAAETAYRDALAAYNAARSGETPEGSESSAPDTAASEAEPSADTAPEGDADTAAEGDAEAAAVPGGDAG